MKKSIDGQIFFNYYLDVLQISHLTMTIIIEVVFFLIFNFLTKIRVNQLISLILSKT